jgi:hypothetical protein
VKSLLKEACASEGVEILFLPKFHCELNPIEMVWGYAKCLYCTKPMSSKEEALEQNTIDSINAVPLTAMWHFVNRTNWFADAYLKGLDCADAAYIVKKYRSHQNIPPGYEEELKNAPQPGQRPV